jgi:hypothetical protein
MLFHIVGPDCPSLVPCFSLWLYCPPVPGPRRPGPPPASDDDSPPGLYRNVRTSVIASLYTMHTLAVCVELTSGRCCTVLGPRRPGPPPPSDEPPPGGCCIPLVGRTMSVCGAIFARVRVSSGRCVRLCDGGSLYCAFHVCCVIPAGPRRPGPPPPGQELPPGIPMGAHVLAVC